MVLLETQVVREDNRKGGGANGNFACFGDATGAPPKKIECGPRLLLKMQVVMALVVELYLLRMGGEGGVGGMGM